LGQNRYDIWQAAAVAGAIHRYGFPRTDLQVTLDGVTIRPAFALGGWIAFQPMKDTAMVMGDLVLLQTEVNPVMAKLLDGGLEVTAVHNHLLRAEPLTFYMHVGGPRRSGENGRDYPWCAGGEQNAVGSPGDPCHASGDRS